MEFAFPEKGVRLTTDGVWEVATAAVNKSIAMVGFMDESYDVIFITTRDFYS
jgi:hypothetical protein